MFQAAQVGVRVWIGPVPVTAPLRTLEDCATAHLQPDLLRDAARSLASLRYSHRPALSTNPGSHAVAAQAEYPCRTTGVGESSSCPVSLPSMP